MPRQITLVGARGGHGTTTIATALALHASHAGATVLISSDAAATAALIGVPVPVDGEWVEVTPALALAPSWTREAWATDTVVVDAGKLGDAIPACAGSERYIVLRGPCYVAVATLLARNDTPFDGIILVTEPERSLTSGDVTDVLGLPIVASVSVTPRVARAIDAGLLSTRLPRLRELTPLRQLGLARPRTLEKEHTDLPLSPCDNGKQFRRVPKAQRQRLPCRVRTHHVRVASS